MLEGKITKQLITKILNKVIVFDKEEITKEQQALYNVDNDTYNEIWKNGGIVLVFAYNVQHVFTSGWL